MNFEIPFIHISFTSAFVDLVEEVIGVIEERYHFRVIGPIVVDPSVVVEAEESSLIVFDGATSGEKHLTAALLNFIT